MPVEFETQRRQSLKKILVKSIPDPEQLKRSPTRTYSIKEAQGTRKLNHLPLTRQVLTMSAVITSIHA